MDVAAALFPLTGCPYGACGRRRGGIVEGSGMARVTVVYWQDIPSMVEARDRAGRHKVALSARFQELIDRVAMREGLHGTDDYLLQWRRGAPEEHPGGPEDSARAVADSLEARFESIREAALGRG
jgi:hypothetical protein